MDLEDLFAQDQLLQEEEAYSWSEFTSGPKTVALRLLQRDPLWANHVWNGARWLAEHLLQKPELVRGKRVLEMGAAAGLPSIVASQLGASLVALSILMLSRSWQRITQTIASCRTSPSTFPKTPQQKIASSRRAFCGARGRRTLRRSLLEGPTMSSSWPTWSLTTASTASCFGRARSSWLRMAWSFAATRTTVRGLLPATTYSNLIIASLFFT